MAALVTPALTVTVPSPPRPAVVASSSSPSRQLFYAVRKGHQAGVYSSWQDAELQIKGSDSPIYKTFSTRMAAEAFVDGWDGAGRHSLPPSTPLPLREHLGQQLPGRVSTSSPSRHRPRPSLNQAGPSSGLKPPRSTYGRTSSSSSAGAIRRSSPLRQEVTEQSASIASVTLSSHGLLTPPTSPEQGDDKFASFDNNGKRKATAMLSPPNSPPASLRHSSSNASLSSIKSSGSAPKRPAANRRASGGLWGADTMSLPAQPASGDQSLLINGQSMNELFADKATPTFSRAALKKSGVTLPIAAPAGRPRSASAQHIPSLPPKTSRWSLSSNNGGLSTLSKTLARKNSLPSFSDRLATLDLANAAAETDFGQRLPPRRSASQTFSISSSKDFMLIEPPRAAFMRATSSSSLSSDASDTSFDSCHTPIPEEEEPEVMIVEPSGMGCTVSEGDADGSVNSTSTRGQPRKKGTGLGKRLMKALGIGRKETRELESRRGSA